MGLIPSITVWQPWASLIAIGAKPYEFRSWTQPSAEKIVTRFSSRGLNPVGRTRAAYPLDQFVGQCSDMPLIGYAVAGCPHNQIRVERFFTKLLEGIQRKLSDQSPEDSFKGHNPRLKGGYVITHRWHPGHLLRKIP